MVRNKVKRRLRAAFRESMGDILPGRKMIFVARPAVAEADYAAIRRDMQSLLRRAKLLRQKPQ